MPMMTIASLIRAVGRLAPRWTVLAGTTLVLGQTALAEDTMSVLMKHRLAKMTAKEATVRTEEQAPGAASQQHVQPSSVYAYVLEEAVVSQLEGGEPVTHTRGQSRYESPKKPQDVSKNASKTE